MKASAFILCFLAVAGVASRLNAHVPTRTVDITEGDVHGLVNKLEEQLAPGWTVGYRHKYQEIEIARKAPSRLSFIVPNPPPEQADKIEVASYEFIITLSPLFSSAEYQREKSENQKAQRRMDVIYDALSNSQTVHGIHQPVFGGSCFSSKIPEEQARIDEYYRLEGKMHRLPDGYLDDVSVTLPGFPTWDYGFVPEDQDDRSECEQAYKRVAAVLSKY